MLSFDIFWANQVFFISISLKAEFEEDIILVLQRKKERFSLDMNQKQ